MFENDVTILLAEDHELVMEGIESLLHALPGYYVVGKAKNGKELIDKYFKLKPDVVLADINMPEMSGPDAMKEVLKTDPSALFLFLSMFQGEDYINMIYSAGGRGLINKDISKGELSLAIKLTAEGKYYFGPGWDVKKLEELKLKYEKKKGERPDGVESLLTVREREIIDLIAQGLTSKEIAEKLFLSKRTVDSHRARIMAKLDIHSLPEFIKLAVNLSKTK